MKQKQPVQKVKIIVNQNGVTCYIRGKECHATYYAGDGVEFEKTFQNLTIDQIKKLDFEDVMF